jgi:3',5'-cyclic AMP phosphodiesterase CpdA
MLRFVVIADSHIRPPDQEVDTYPSNAWLVERNEAVVEMCNGVDASFVVHLGDIVHPLPTQDSHASAIGLAQEVYGRLDHPIHFVAGNHDVGDKPNAHVAVPAVDEENYAAYEAAWGDAFRSFDEAGCHFVIIDAQILNSGFGREARQRQWLEADLETASIRGQRIFMFMHYPPFVRDRHENEHYDNIGEPARSWLLDACDHHGVEAVFSGHVHNFLYNRHGSTAMYVAPATGFVRPDYAELSAVVPTGENGRDDPPKLGVFIVDVTEDGHTVRPLRTFGARGRSDLWRVPREVAMDPTWESPIGVALRHGWMSVVEFPTAGLDEFNRKRIRNDATLLGLWEARIRDVRIPLADLDTPTGLRRVADLYETGMRFTVFSPGVPNAATVALVGSAAPVIHRWEVIVEVEAMRSAIEAVARADIDGISVAIAPILATGPDSSQVHHFVAAGWPPGDDVDGFAVMDPHGTADELVFRVPHGSDIAHAAMRAATGAGAHGRSAVIIVDLPRGSESVMFADDAAVAARVEEAVHAAVSNPDVSVFLDGFLDHDRGYYPRHGLLDRAYNPRPALYRLIEAASASAG